MSSVDSFDPGTPQKVAPQKVRVAVVEDHLLQRTRTVELLRAAGDLQVVASVETLPDFVSWLRGTPRPDWPQLLVLDLMVERGESADPALIERLTKVMSVLVLSALASPPLVRAVLRAGVKGVVGKRDSESDILGAVHSVLDDEGWLTPDLASVIAGDPDRPKLSIQEERAMVLYASGLTLDAVAGAIGVKPHTAKKYLARVKAKYAEIGRPVYTKIDIARAAREDGFFDRG
ncbi:response regulator [Pseudoclavibacter terrae]|uniref:response regulator n=1 Tax=Pseudoclavibacter terrae TaxID=1530195 RepID=UPI00232F5349|nr:response regulator [Pseudoclavibacter terrae]